MSSNPDEPKSRAWTDCLLNNEFEVQQSWDENNVFEADAGSEPPGQQQQQQQQQHSLLSQASWGRLEMKPKRDEKQGDT
jgi:hypothetical protein